MATLVFSAIGTLLGGPIGGAIGALAGRQVDALIFAPPARQGPRLNELSLSASSYGQAIPRQHGRVRTGGQVIWATDLVERSSRQGNGKSRPATVTYSYSASFAVAISSRPIETVGRIWADGKLLRGAAGDLKVGGAVRVHQGHDDQMPDPLIAAAEGAANPACRGLAYVVFEDLQLADFGNRIPTLSFEVIADSQPFLLQDLIDPSVPDCAAAVPLNSLDGLVVEGSPAELLNMLDPLFPIACDACAPQLTLRPERSGEPAIVLPEPAIAEQADAFGRQAGFARHRALDRGRVPSVLRHYDPDRDYQPGAQRSAAVRVTGQPQVIELPATMTAAAARNLIEMAAKRTDWTQQRLAWRVSQLDPAVRPGSQVTLTGQSGTWRVKAWEWRAEGVELQLERVAPSAPDPAGASDPGRVALNPDTLPGPTGLFAFELPWDGNPATPVPQLYAAVGGGPGWNGASLWVDQGDSALQPLGTASRGAAAIGTCVTALQPASPQLFDRHAIVTVALANPSIDLADATMRQLVQGANRALLGQEIIQFGSAQPLGGGRWQLSGLLRGRGGTEHAVAIHTVGEPFALLDGMLTALDPALVGPAGQAMIGALGLADPAPVWAPIELAGAGWRPLNPVHGQAAAAPGGQLELRWTRRARGGWVWDNGVDLPLNEQRELYLVEFGAEAAPLTRWECSAPGLSIPAAEWAALHNAAPDGVFAIRQAGDRNLSAPLIVRPDPT